jgi:hypothetical protein
MTRPILESEVTQLVFHGTTILALRHKEKVVVAGDGQVTAAVQQAGDGTVWHLTPGIAFVNHGLAEDDHGQLLPPLLRRVPAGGVVAFDTYHQFGVSRVPLAANAVSVQLNFARAGAGLAIVHDFALPAAPELVRVLPDQVRLMRTFWLVTHAGPRDARLDRFTTLLRDGMRAEIARQEASVA